MHSVFQEIVATVTEWISSVGETDVNSVLFQKPASLACFINSSFSLLSISW